MNPHSPLITTLETIRDMAPATCETSLAHDMAHIADETDARPVVTQSPAEGCACVYCAEIGAPELCRGYDRTVQSDAPAEHGGEREKIDAILQQAVSEDDYAKGAHRFFQADDVYGDRARAVSAILAALQAAPASEPEGMSDAERHRWKAGRSDWRDAYWQDHCGDPSCGLCDGEIPMTKPRLAAPAADLRETRAYRDGMRAGFRMGEGGEAERYEAALAKMQSEITEASKAAPADPAADELTERLIEMHRLAIAVWNADRDPSMGRTLALMALGDKAERLSETLVQAMLYVAYTRSAAPADPVAGAGEVGIASKLIERLESWPISFVSGVCMCGAEMNGHSAYDNHAPTDSGEYNVHEAIKEAKAAIAALAPSVEKLVGALRQVRSGLTPAAKFATIHRIIDEALAHAKGGES